MEKLKVSFIIVFIFLLIPLTTYGVVKLGQTGFKFLSIGMGARPTAMGEAFTVIGDDPSALFYNPAGIAKITNKFSLVANVTDWVADISYNAAALVVNGGNWGNFGISLISPNYPSIIGTQVAATDEGYIETGELEVGAFGAGLSYARKLTDKFMVGGQVKFVSQHLGSNRYEEVGEMHKNRTSGMAYDLGTIFYPGFGVESFGFGMFIRNFSTQLTYEETPFQLPLSFSLGFAVDLFDFLGEWLPGSALNVEIDAIHPRDYTERINLGLEYSYKDMFVIRGGYKFNYDEEGLTLGVGFKIVGFSFDYAYGSMVSFNTINRVSIGMAF